MCVKVFTFATIIIYIVAILYLFILFNPLFKLFHFIILSSLTYYSIYKLTYTPHDLLQHTYTHMQVVDANGMTCLHLAATTAAKLAVQGRQLRESANICHEIAKNVLIQREAIAEASRLDKEKNGTRTRSPAKLLAGMVSSAGGGKKEKRDPLIVAAEKEAKEKEAKASSMEKKAKEATR